MVFSQSIQAPPNTQDDTANNTSMFQSAVDAVQVLSDTIDTSCSVLLHDVVPTGVTDLTVQKSSFGTTCARRDGADAANAIAVEVNR